jgi:hypothetical protein
MADFKAEDYRLRDPVDSHLTGAVERAPNEPELLTTYQPPAISGVVSFLSSNERQGHWELPRRFRALAVMGNVELDLREAEVGYGVSLIEAVAVMGNIEITIPPDIAVECDGDTLLGSFTLKYDGRANPAAANRERTIRITGTAYAANVEVVVKGPDEKMLAKLGRKLGARRE